MTEDTTKALSASVLSIDASRRVGWAKAYAAEESKDELSRDLNIARGDLAAVSKLAGFLYGAVSVLHPRLIELLPKGIDRTLVLAVLPVLSVNAGRRAAQALKPKTPKTKAVQITLTHDDDICPWKQHAKMWEARAKDSKTRWLEEKRKNSG